MIRRIKVVDLCLELREACNKRGHSYDDEITVLEAVMAWSGWHTGDPTLATKIIYLYEHPEDAE